MEDPFSCFGSDSDDDTETATNAVPPPSVPPKIPSSINAPPKPAVSSADPLPLKRRFFFSQFESDESDEPDRDAFPSLDPLYVGPISVVSYPSSTGIGGGRGVCPTRDISAGTLLLVELPAIVWDGDGADGAAPQDNWERMWNTLCRKMREGNGTEENPIAETVRALRHLHPLPHALDRAVEPDTLEAARAQFAGSVRDLSSRLSPAWREILPAAEPDLYQLLFALRYNAFPSGLYPHAAMFNHGEDANCVKYPPARAGGWSEIRCTRDVKRGEPLTIGYVPQLVGHVTRRNYLRAHHSMDIGATPYADVPGPRGEELRDTERIRGAVPDEKKDGEVLTTTIEASLGELEERYDRARQTLDALITLEDDVVEHILGISEAIENSTHVLMCRAYILHVSVGEDIMLRRSDPQRALLRRLLTSLRKLLAVQTTLFGTDHPDVASTYDGLSQYLGTMLRCCSRELFDMGVTEWKNESEAAKKEWDYRKEAARIKKLYPQDVEDKIKEYSGKKEKQ